MEGKSTGEAILRKHGSLLACMSFLCLYSPPLRIQSLMRMIHCTTFQYCSQGKISARTIKGI